VQHVQTLLYQLIETDRELHGDDEDDEQPEPEPARGRDRRR
jgi:hypothetical protein